MKWLENFRVTAISMMQTKSYELELHTIVFHEKLLNLDLHCYKFRSGQKQKEILEVQGFIFCNF